MVSVEQELPKSSYKLAAATCSACCWSRDSMEKSVIVLAPLESWSGSVTWGGRPQVADEGEGERGADELHQHEHRRRGRLDPGERVGERAGDGHGRVGEA